MRLKLRVLACVLAFVSTAVWFFGGPNLGRTRTSETFIRVDSATGAERPETEPRLAIGVDLLAASWACAGAVFGCSLLARRH
jgi:hypothetical protein